MAGPQDGKREYSWEIRERAQELYVADGLTYEETAAATGVSVTQIQRWAVKFGWGDKRRSLQKELADQDLEFRQIKKNLTQAALEKLDPQLVYALVRMEQLTRKKDKKPAREIIQEIDRPRLFLENLEFIAQALKESDPEGLKVLARNFEPLVAKFKAAHEKTA